MHLLGHRFLRGTVLGFMFLLAGTACCWSDAYDPDPYDNTPPVVTVDFNYVVPSCASIRSSNVHFRKLQATVSRVFRQQDAAISLALLDNHGAPAFSQNRSHMVIPLRR
ncbi:MAG: hypothetical protein LAO78_23560 [Acidobacteriia bacterium]|nr:hypothetical protein [Terriglobia bacterium]